ncbi:MAG: 16S rRNA (cytidine(1402)-2'-O)-methyltransferase [Campylobacterota bacterium]|nr:16S rRNA (cytidine(1402)-2'-O)-methyltransferase [Campylobacterota bacterium]
MLTFVPAPIGNLGDISFRTIEVLKGGELILCEDTRVTKKLLQLISQRYEITFPKFDFISLHSHNEQKFLNDEAKQLFESKNCIYMSDAGMPCVSDPGSYLVDFCLEYEIEYDVLPGANAILTAYASSGFNDTKFSFFGFLPHKGMNRDQELQKVLDNEYLSILYESPHRLLKLLKQLNDLAPDKEIFLAKELTKKFQTRYKGVVCDIYEELKTKEIKGEWVVVIKNEYNGSKGVISLDDIKDLKLPPKQKAKLISKLTGENVKDIYNQLIG